MNIIRRAFKRDVLLIGDTTVKGKAFQRFEPVSQVAKYRDQVFLLTQRIVESATKEPQEIKPYKWRYFPKVVLWILNKVGK